MLDSPKSEGQAVRWLEHAEGRVAVEELPDGRRKVVTYPNPGEYPGTPEWVTAYPFELIEAILPTLSPGDLCGEIMRDEDPKFVSLFLRYSLLGYFPAEAFRGVRILDFGSGRGASTVVLARMFPEAEIVGVELERDLNEVAKLRAKCLGLSNRIAVRFSPRIVPGTRWAGLLRDGVRGGTARSVHRDIESGGGDAVRLEPELMGLRSHADLWYRYSTEIRPHPIKRVMHSAFALVSRITGQPFAPGLSLAFQKRG